MRRPFSSNQPCRSWAGVRPRVDPDETRLVQSLLAGHSGDGPRLCGHRKLTSELLLEVRPACRLASQPRQRASLARVGISRAATRPSQNRSTPSLPPLCWHTFPRTARVPALHHALVQAFFDDVSELPQPQAGDAVHVQGQGWFLLPHLLPESRRRLRRIIWASTPLPHVHAWCRAASGVEAGGAAAREGIRTGASASAIADGAGTAGNSVACAAILSRASPASCDCSKGTPRATSVGADTQDRIA